MTTVAVNIGDIQIYFHIHIGGVAVVIEDMKDIVMGFRGGFPRPVGAAGSLIARCRCLVIDIIHMAGIWIYGECAVLTPEA